jgi:hypothetical protein
MLQPSFEIQTIVSSLKASKYPESFFRTCCVIDNFLAPTISKAPRKLPQHLSNPFRTDFFHS